MFVTYIYSHFISPVSEVCVCVCQRNMSLVDWFQLSWNHLSKCKGLPIVLYIWDEVISNERMLSLWTRKLPAGKSSEKSATVCCIGASASWGIMSHQCGANIPWALGKANAIGFTWRVQRGTIMGLRPGNGTVFFVAGVRCACSVHATASG